MHTVFQNIVPDSLWAHLIECWECGFGYEQSVSYSFAFTHRLFDVAMQACDDDFDAYMFESDRAMWRKGQ